MMYAAGQAIGTGGPELNQKYAGMQAEAAATNAYRPQDVQTSQTLMQALHGELESLLSSARANLDAVASQRGRLLGDVPPSPGNPALEKDRVAGGSISFNDIGISISRLRDLLLTANEHLMSMRKIG